MGAGKGVWITSRFLSLYSSRCLLSLGINNNDPMQLARLSEKKVILVVRGERTRNSQDQQSGSERCQ